MVLVQEYVDPDMFDVGVNNNPSPLQMAVERLAGAFVMSGEGFTVTVTGKVGPVHPLDEGVMI
jgi:hypothetical protein